MQLSIRQKQETLSGSCTLFRPNVIRVPFSGTIDDRGVLQFSIHIDNPSNFTITFTGKVNKDMKIMSGTYMTSNGQRGTWIMHLA